MAWTSSRCHPDDTERAAVRAELGIGEGQVMVGVVGRLVWEKGYREVFAAAAVLRCRRLEVRFVASGRPRSPRRTLSMPTSRSSTAG